MVLEFRGIGRGKRSLFFAYVLCLIAIVFSPDALFGNFGMAWGTISVIWSLDTVRRGEPCYLHSGCSNIHLIGPFQRMSGNSGEASCLATLFSFENTHREELTMLLQSRVLYVDWTLNLLIWPNFVSIAATTSFTLF
jgi:hypothetical protein